MRALDLTGEKHYRLRVIERAGSSPHGKTTWLCECECGKLLVVVGSSLLNGNTQSCGCYKAKTSAENGRNSRRLVKTHGGHNERLYRVWADMKRRCNNPHFKQYKDYMLC